MRLLPPPKIKPEPFLLRRDAPSSSPTPTRMGGQALRRIQRLLLGWSDYRPDGLSGYETLGWWDLQLCRWLERVLLMLL